MRENALLTAKDLLVKAMEECLLACEIRCEKTQANIRSDIEDIRALLYTKCQSEQALLLLLEDYCKTKIRWRYRWYTLWLWSYPNHVWLFVVKTLRRFQLSVRLMAERALNAKQDTIISEMTRINAQLHQQLHLLSSQICDLEQRMLGMYAENKSLKSAKASADDDTPTSAP